MRLPAGREGTVPESFARIVAEDVVFTYPGSASPALRGLTVRLERGDAEAGFAIQELIDFVW